MSVAVSPEQMVKELTATVGAASTVTFIVKGVPHCPEFGVNV